MTDFRRLTYVEVPTEATIIIKYKIEQKIEKLQVSLGMDV
jgi:hypothetical protein